MSRPAGGKRGYYRIPFHRPTVQVMYNDKMMTAYEIAEAHGCSKFPVECLLKRMGILRSRSESRKLRNRKTTNK
jgi:hypothetical protein